MVRWVGTLGRDFGGFGGLDGKSEGQFPVISSSVFTVTRGIFAPPIFPHLQTLPL